MSIVSTYKPEGGTTRKQVRSEDEARLIAPIVEKILPLSKYQNIIAQLRIAVQSQVGVANFVTGNECGELLDAILQAAFPRDTGQVYMGDEYGYDLDASTVFGGDHGQAVDRFMTMLMGRQYVLNADDIKKIETMKGEFSDAAVGQQAIDLVMGKQTQGGGGNVFNPTAQPQAATDPNSIPALLEIRTKLIKVVEESRQKALSIDRIADPKTYNFWVNMASKAEMALAAQKLPKLDTHLQRPVYDKSGFLDFEIKAVTPIISAIDNLIDPQRMNQAIDTAAVAMAQSGVNMKVDALDAKTRRIIAKKLIDRVRTKLDAMRVGGKPSVVGVVDKIDAILKEGVEGVTKGGGELKRLREELQQSMKGQQKVWIIQNATDSALVNRPHGTQEVGESNKPMFLPRALLKSTMAKKDAVSQDRCILFVSAEPIDFGFVGFSPVVLPTGIDEEEAKAIVAFFEGRWKKRMRDSGIDEKDIAMHLKLRFGDIDKLKMLIAGVPHKEAIRRLNDAFAMVYDPVKLELDGKKMTDVVTKLSNESAASGAGGGAKGLTFLDAKMDWVDYIWKDDDQYEWGEFCDTTMNAVNMAKDLWEKEARLRSKYDVALGKPNNLAEVQSLMRKITQIAGQAKKLIDMPHFLILYGEAASGKSSFAEALANLLGFRIVDVDLGQARGMYAGQTETQSKALLNAVKSMSNVVIRMDEIDGQIASNEDAAVNSHNASVVQQLLSFFNDNVGLLTKRNIFVVATTNNPGYVRSQMLSRGTSFEVPLPLNKAGYLKFLSNAPERLRRQLGSNDFVYGDFTWNGKAWSISSEAEASAFITEAWKTIDLPRVAETLDGKRIDFRSLAMLLRAIFREFLTYLMTTENHKLWTNDRKTYAEDNPERCSEPGNPSSCQEPEIMGFDMTTESILKCVEMTIMKEVSSYGSRLDGTNIVPRLGVYPYQKMLKRERQKAKQQDSSQGLLFSDESIFQPQPQGDDQDEDLLTPVNQTMDSTGKQAKSTSHFINALVKDGLVTWDGRTAIVSPKAPSMPGAMKADESPRISEQKQTSSARRRKSLEEKFGIYMVGNTVLAPCNRKVIL
jgi:hypothetical protein